MEELLGNYGYWAVLLGTFLEGETVLVLAGFAAHRGYLQLDAVIAVAFLGTLCGDQLFFWLGRRRGQATLSRHPGWGRRLGRPLSLLERHPVAVILGFRFLYGLRTVTPFAIGLSGISAGRFAAFNAAGAGVWAVAVGLAGYGFGRALEAVLADVKRYEVEAMVFVAATGAAAWVWRLARSRRRTSS